MNTESKFGMTGNVVAISEIKMVGKNNKQLQTLLLDDGADPYPQQIEFEFLGGWTKELVGLKAGDRIAVSFDIRCREWQGRHFVSLAGRTITRCANEQTEEPKPEPVAETAPAPVQDELNNLPF